MSTDVQTARHPTAPVGRPELALLLASMASNIPGDSSVLSDLRLCVARTIRARLTFQAPAHGFAQARSMPVPVLRIPPRRPPVAAAQLQLRGRSRARGFAILIRQKVRCCMSTVAAARPLTL